MERNSTPKEFRIGDTVEIVVPHPDGSEIEIGDVATVFCYYCDDDSPYNYGVVFDNPPERVLDDLHSLFGVDEDGNTVDINNGGFWVYPDWITRVDDSWVESQQPDLGELF